MKLFSANIQLRWAIRNCGLLLFRSIIDYLLGTNTRKATIESGWDGKSLKIAYESYPSLPGLLINILQTDTVSSVDTGLQDDTGAIESVFPVLDLIRRAGPPQAESEKIKSLVLGHLQSRVWAIRDIAAQTISALIPKDNWALEVQRMLVDALDTDTNHRYGTLCAANYVLERGLKLDPLKLIGKLLVNTCWNVSDGYGCQMALKYWNQHSRHRSSTIMKAPHSHALPIPIS